jgi:dsRNA-specific ribonuclease
MPGYTCGVYFEGTELGRGSGSSKQAAEVAAAKAALHALSLDEDPDHLRAA